MISFPGIDFFMVLAVYIIIFLIITLSYNLAYGYTGIPDFGRAMAAGAGGFLCGYFPGRLAARMLGIKGDYLEQVIVVVDKVNLALEQSPALSIGILILSLIVGFIVAGSLGLFASLPIFRGIRLFYLGVTLLSIQISFNTIIYHWEPIIRGEHGVPVPDPFRWLTRYNLFGLSPGQMRALGMIVASTIVLVITWYFCTSLARSPAGRLLKAVRDDEKCIEALGRDVKRLYVKVMVLSYALTGMAGVLFAYYQGYIIGLHFERVTWTFWPIAMVILGGLASNKGTVLGTALFITMKRLITFYKRDLEGFLPFSPVWLDGLLLGVSLIILLIYAPRGLVPEKPELTIKRSDIERLRREVLRTEEDLD
ncbi:MAG TPA: branched-chain amino acid ABC transporter permease [Candidatus Korarchaeota archaeon]|nr:branched-chain amino acid ABC transporter permease [Candidatus Korarchaeota archaeon]